MFDVLYQMSESNDEKYDWIWDFMPKEMPPLIWNFESG